MPVVFDTLLVELALDRIPDNMCLFQKFISCIHLRPLERGKRLRNKEGSACHDLYFPVPLFLRNRLIVSLGYLIGQYSNAFDIFFRFCWQAKHKIQLYLVPATLECCGRTAKDIIDRKALVDDITHTLCTCFRCKGQGALLDILHLAHNVQRKSIDTQGRQGNIDLLSVTFFDQIVDKLRKLGVITRA